jgi:hypothetical protein
VITRQTLLRTTFAASLLSLALVGCGSMKSSSVETYHASLSASQEVPTNPSVGRGEAEVRFNRDTNMLSWNVTHSGLSGPATAGHIHGPAGPGQNAGVVVPFTGDVNASRVRGEKAITAAQAADLQAGRWYVNLHTARFPGGEIRGQLQRR